MTAWVFAFFILGAIIETRESRRSCYEEAVGEKKKTPQ